jgi:hypothetical protein
MIASVHDSTMLRRKGKNKSRQLRENFSCQIDLRFLRLRTKIGNIVQNLLLIQKSFVDLKNSQH